MFFAPHDPQLTNVSPTFHRSGVVFLDMARNEIGPQGFELMCSALATRQIRDGCWQQGTRKKNTESVMFTCWYELVKFGGTLQKKSDGLKPYSVPY